MAIQLSEDAEVVLCALQSLSRARNGHLFPVFRCVLVHAVADCWDDLHAVLRELSTHKLVTLEGFETAKLTTEGLAIKVGQPAFCEPTFVAMSAT